LGLISLASPNTHTPARLFFGVCGRVYLGWTEEYRGVVDDFVEGAGINHQLLDVAKTREMAVDFKEEEDSSTTAETSGRGCGHGGGVQVPGCLHRQQTELEGQHQRCVQEGEGEESTLFLQETVIL